MHIDACWCDASLTFMTSLVRTFDITAIKPAVKNILIKKSLKFEFY